MALHARRLTLGPHLSEGARLLWEACKEAESIGVVRKKLGFTSDEMARLLYCDRAANLTQANRCHAVLGIPQTAWESAPAAPIELPALEEARRAVSQARPRGKRRSPPDLPAAL